MASNDPLPLSRQQVKALTVATTRELSWGLPRVDRKLRRWSQLAEQIPDESIRADALKSFSNKRGHIAGAALFAILPTQRSDELLQILVSFEMIVDFLDDVHERHPTMANGNGLHRAVVDALTPGEPLGDYYADHCASDDAGYLRALVEDCRRHCQALPSFSAVQPLLIREAGRARRALTLNHLPDPVERDRAMRSWAEAEFPDCEEWQWFELTAAASGQLMFFILFALAAKPGLDELEVTVAFDAYWPLLPLITNMLDSFVDQVEDSNDGNHRYISHYQENGYAIDRMCELIAIAAGEMLRLPDGHRHAVILGCLVSFYLAKDSARSPALEPATKRLIRAGGSLPRALAPILRTWRTVYAQRAA